MIQSFRHKGLKRFFQSGDASKINPGHLQRLRLILSLLNAAHDISDMNFPGSHLHKLRGDKAGFWAVSVSSNWRLMFRFEQGDAYDVDYH